MSRAVSSFVLAHSRAMIFLALCLVVAGLSFLTKVPISLFPQTDFPRIIILVDNGVMPAEQVQVLITRPIEEAIRVVPGIQTIRSITTRGSAEVSVFFNWDVDILNSLHLVQGRLSQIAPTLPPTAKFYINRLTFSVFPIVGVSLTSPKRSLTELWDLGYYTIARRLYRVSGVSEVRIVGGRPPEYHVLVDPVKLNSYGFPVARVTDAIRRSNIISAAGIIQENHQLYMTTVTGLVRDKEQVENIVVDVVKGVPVLVRDVARVEIGEKPTYNIVTANGRPAVLLNILQEPQGNLVAIADQVNQELQDIKRALPSDVELSTFYDQSLLVREAIGSVRDSIILGLLLSILVLLLFLRNVRTALLAALVIPISVLMAVILIKLFNMTFNLMTLGGIAACIGIVIDDAIVVVENIMVHLRMGQDPRTAAMSAITELTPALIGSTLTPIVVFVPLVFLGGITAVFFRALALTLVTALLASLVLAIGVTPVLAAWILKPASRAPSDQPPEAVGAANSSDAPPASPTHDKSLGARLNRGYERILRGGLRRPGWVLLISGLLLVAGILLYTRLGTGFLPEIDEGAFVLDYIMPFGTSLEETDRVLRHIESFLRETPEVESYSRRTGAQLGLQVTEPNTGDFLVKLKAARRRDTEEVVDELRRKIQTAEPVIQIEFAGILNDLVGDLTYSPKPIEIRVFHQDLQVIKTKAKEIAEFLRKVPGVVDVLDGVIVIGPAINLRVDKEKAQRAGFTVEDIARFGNEVLEGELASQTVRGERSIGIRVRYPALYRSELESLENLLITSPNGTTLPIRSVVNIEMESGQTEIHRDNLRQMFAVSARLSGRDLGSAIREIQRRLPQEVNLPSGTVLEYGGLYRTQQESFYTLLQVLLMSILLIFIILIFEFQSFAHPIAILASTILCTVGALLALWVTHTTFNISSFMGLIMVIGIVHKNGILMLDSQQHYRESGLGLEDSIFQAGRRRVRPILMTALATICGMLPLSLAVGAGSQILQPLAIAVIGGVAVSMLLSLGITPIIFYTLARGKKRP